MYFVNRAAIVLRPKQAFVDWIHSTPDPPEFITLKGLHEHGNHTVMLIPQVEGEMEAEKLIRELAPYLLDVELGLWYENEDAWPTLDHDTLMEFFEVMVESNVVDIVGEPLRREKM